MLTLKTALSWLTSDKQRSFSFSPTQSSVDLLTFVVMLGTSALSLHISVDVLIM